MNLINARYDEEKYFIFYLNESEKRKFKKSVRIQIKDMQKII